MAEIGIQWSGTSGHLKIGLNVRWEDIASWTTASAVFTDWYVQSQAYGYNDSQRITFQHSLGGYWDYTMVAPSASTTTKYLGTYDIGSQATSYGGGPYWTFGATISGAFDGSAPSIAYGFSLPARPASAPSAPGISVDTVTNSSARINVTASNGNGSGVDWYGAWVATDPGFSNVVASASGGSFYATGLVAATTYYARAQAHNAVGYSGHSGTAVFTTGATIPGVTTGVNATNITQTTARFSWVAPGNGGSAISGYDIQLASNSAFTTGVINFADYNGSPYDASGLTPGQVYYIRVRAVNGVGAGAWSAWGSFAMLQGTPTWVSPADAAVLARGCLDVTLSTVGIKSDSVITVEASQDSSFATGVRTFTSTPGVVSGNSQYRIADYTLAGYLTSGVWYYRAKVATPSLSYTTPWSATRSFTQSHQPSASLQSPVTGSTTEYKAITNFTYKFIDPAYTPDRISAYRLVIENNATNDTVWDSGKVEHSDAGDTFTVSRAISSALKNVTLRWRVMVWDHGDTASAWTGYSVFTMVDLPTVVITAPATTPPVDNGAPLFAWTFGSTGGSTQTSARLVVVDTATNVVVYDHKNLASASSVQPSGVILLNGRSYTATITVVDSFGLVGVGSQNFTTNYVSPEAINYTIDASGMNTLGHVRLSWVDADPDVQFVAWKVYRRNFPGGQWELVKRIDNQNVRNYDDYMLNSSDNYSYSVTQVANRSGAELESPAGFVRMPTGAGGYENLPETRSFVIDLVDYWIINPDNPSTSVRLAGVISDESTLEFDSATYTIVGRGRHRDYGDELGYTGSLTVQVRSVETPNLFRLRIEELRRAQETYYLRTPFGRLFQVALGNIGWSPLRGTGRAEMGDLTIPYEEVS